MRQRRSILILLGFLLALLVIMAAAVSQWHGLTAGASSLAQAAEPPLSGAYRGQVQLEGVYSGVYSDTAAIPAPIDLGRIDLALNLTQSGDAIAGYVMLDDSLVFNQVHTMTVQTSAVPLPDAIQLMQEVATGPMVQGAYDNTTLRLASERFPEQLSASQVLPHNGRTVPARTVTRQFSLTTTTVHEEGARLIGIYRETIWGYATRPSTVVGTFILERPLVAPIAPSTPEAGSASQIFLPFVTRN